MTLYLTRIAFDPELVARLGIRDTYGWHKRGWECFPGHAEDKRDFLTRLEEKGPQIRLLILSRTQPTRPQWCAAEAWQGPKVIGERFLSHRRYRFQVCANATKKVKAFNADGTERPNGRREPLRKREELVAWMKRKAEAGGFAVDESTLQTLRLGQERFRSKSGRGVHNAVEFRGVLAVTDAARFRETFARGLGSAKAFGFGLLALARVG